MALGWLSFRAFSDIWNRVPGYVIHHRIISGSINAAPAPSIVARLRLRAAGKLGAGKDRRPLHLACADRIRPACAGVREEDRHQSGAVARAQREGGAARRDRDEGWT